MNHENEDQAFIADRLRGAANATSPMPIRAAAVTAEASRRRHRSWVAGGLSVAVLGAATALIVTTFGVPGPVEQPSPTVSPSVMGSPTPAPPPTVEVFLDYLSKASADFVTGYGPTLQSMADEGTILLDYRMLTFIDKDFGSDDSTRAAMGASCAQDLGVFDDYSQQVFANQAKPIQLAPDRYIVNLGFSDELLRQEIPEAIGLSGDRLTDFQKCYDTRKYAGEVAAQNESAQAEGVVAVPTVRVQGKDLNLAQYTGPGNNKDLKEAILSFAKSAPAPQESSTSAPPSASGSPTPTAQITPSLGADWKTHMLTNVGISVTMPKTMTTIMDKDFDNGWRLCHTKCYGDDLAQLLVWPESLSGEAVTVSAADLDDQGEIAGLTDATGRPVHIGLVARSWGDEVMLVVKEDSGLWSTLIDFGKGKFSVGGQDKWWLDGPDDPDAKIIIPILASVRTIK